MKERNRLDHILSRGYLNGFAIPGKEDRLNVFNIEKRIWFESSPAAVAAEHGFYDYSEGAAPDATADQAFWEFETKFPVIRKELIEENFRQWTKHCDFLVRYSQMLRARSNLFREEVLDEIRRGTLLSIDEVLETIPSSIRPGELEIKARYSAFQPPNDQLRDALFKNLTITKMREEIKKGAGEFAGWFWCLRYTLDVTRPFVTSDNAVGLIGFGPLSRGAAMAHPDTLFVFPFCWQACLIGSPRKFDIETEGIHPALLSELQHRFLNESDGRFAYSPHRLD
jgi:Protein of unknown function (DUF4238)